MIHVIYVLSLHSMWSWEALEYTYVYKYRAISLKIVSIDSDSCLAIGCPADRSHIFQWNIIHSISNLIKNATLNASANKNTPCVKVFFFQFVFSLIYFWLRNNHKLYNFKINMIISLSPMRNNMIGYLKMCNNYLLWFILQIDRCLLKYNLLIVIAFRPVNV